MGVLQGHDEVVPGGFESENSRGPCSRKIQGKKRVVQAWAWKSTRGLIDVRNR